MYIRVYAYEYVIQLCRPTFKCDCEFVYACIKACIHMLVMYVCIRPTCQCVCEFVYTCIKVCIHMLVYVCFHACMHDENMSECMHACMYACEVKDG